MLLEDKIQYYNLITNNEDNFEFFCSPGELLALNLATQTIAFFRTFSVHYLVIILSLDSVQS